mgnify:CR=1 FL=1
MKVIKLVAGRLRGEDFNNISLIDYDRTKQILLAEDCSYMIHNNVRFPLTFVRTVKFGDPTVESSKAYMKLAQRDVSMYIMYRTENRDFTIVKIHDGTDYKFDHIKFHNLEFRV